MIDLDKLALIQATLKQPRFERWDYSLIPGRTNRCCVINTKSRYISGDDFTLLTFELGNPIAIDYNGEAVTFIYGIEKDETSQTISGDNNRKIHVR